MNERSQWGTRLGFLLAAIGSAVGLGNIWRFPATAYENGGGAFFIPYLFALLTAGITILIMEFTIGNKYRSSSPRSFSKMGKGMEWIGWWQVLISFVISTYYPVIIAWSLMFAYFSFGTKWGGDTSSFFFDEFLNMTDPGSFGSIVPNVFIPLLIVWTIVFFIMGKGVKRGIELANRIFIPTLMIIFVIIVIRAITLPGALEGLNAFFEPNWESIMDGSVWVAAYGQIFFSLSIAFAIMITYSSYLPKKSDITNNAFITGFANSSFELLAGIGVFAILGFMALQSGATIDQVVKSGVALAFVVFPEIISQMPASSLFGILFFLSLFLAGISSMISITETYIAGVQEKFSISRSKAIIFGAGLSFVISLLYATQGGLVLLDTVDYFINNYGVALAGLFEVVAIAWFARILKDLQNHADGQSSIKLGWWWRLSIGVITPVVLGYMMLQNLRNDLQIPYEGYPFDFLFNFGWLLAIGVMFLGALLTIKKWPSKDHEA